MTRRALRVRRVTAATAFAVVGLLAAGGMAGAAAGDEGSGDEVAGVSFEVTNFGPDILRSGQSLVVSATVQNSALDPALGLSLVLTMTRAPIVARANLARWATDELDVEMRELGRTLVAGNGTVPPAAMASASLVANPDTLDVEEGATVVHGIEILLEHDGQPMARVRTFATWLGPDATVTPVSVIVLASGSTERVDALVGAGGAPTVTFAVDPTALSPTAIGSISLPETLVIPAGNIDVPSLARAGDVDLLDYALGKSRELGVLPGSTPWIALATDLDRATVDFAASRGAAAVMSLPAFATAEPVLEGFSGGVPPGFAIVSGAADGEPLLLLPDPSLSAAVTDGLPGSATSTARVIAETALLAQENTAANPIVVVAGPSWSVSAAGPATTLVALLTSPWVEPVALSDAIAAVEPAIATLPFALPSSTDVSTGLITAAESAFGGISALASTTPDADAFAGSLLDSLFAALSFDRRTDAVERDQVLILALAAIDETRSKVRLPEGSTLNLISNTGNVPVTVTNDLDVPVTVRVVLESRTPILRIDDRPEVTVESGTSLQVLIPVTAISSGNANIRMSLTDSSGVRLTPTVEVQMRIRAQWGTLSTVILGSLVALLFFAGVVRTARRGRADSRQGPSPVPWGDAEATR